MCVAETIRAETGRAGLPIVPLEDRMKESFIYRRLIRPILDLLRQGVTPEKLALSLALGLVLSVFPAVGWTTTLCALAALIFRLNIAAIQMINYFMYPAQIALLLPFFRLGEKLFRAPHLPISIPHIYWPTPILGAPSGSSGARRGTRWWFGLFLRRCLQC